MSINRKTIKSLKSTRFHRNQPHSDKWSKFIEAYQGIHNWHQNVQSNPDRQTRTLGNRIRIWPDAPKITEMLNSPIQGTSADIIKMALCLLHEWVSVIEIKIVACIHDEIILEASMNEVEKAKEILRDSMVEAGQVYLKSVPVEVDVSVVENWADKT
jgi:DNA polymerase I